MRLIRDGEKGVWRWGTELKKHPSDVLRYIIAALTLLDLLADLTATENMVIIFNQC